MVDDKGKLLNRKQVPSRLGMSLATFNRLERSGNGPPYVQTVRGGSKSYDSSDVDAWWNSRKSSGGHQAPSANEEVIPAEPLDIARKWESEELHRRFEALRRNGGDETKGRFDVEAGLFGPSSAYSHLSPLEIVHEDNEVSRYIQRLVDECGWTFTIDPTDPHPRDDAGFLRKLLYQSFIAIHERETEWRRGDLRVLPVNPNY